METKKEYVIYMRNSEEETELKTQIKTKDFSEVKILALLAAECFADVIVQEKYGRLVLIVHDYSEEENGF